jgi:hypothetical protein
MNIPCAKIPRKIPVVLSTLTPNTATENDNVSNRNIHSTGEKKGRKAERKKGRVGTSFIVPIRFPCSSFVMPEEDPSDSEAADVGVTPTVTVPKLKPVSRASEFWRRPDFGTFETLERGMKPLNNLVKAVRQ